MPGGGVFQVGPGNPSKIMYAGPAVYGDQPYKMTQGESEGLALQRNQLAFQKDTQLPFEAGQHQADRDLQARLQGNQLGYEGQQAAWNRDFSAQQQQSAQGFQGQQAAAQRDFQGQQNAAERANQFSIAQMPWDYKNKVFGTISPLLQGLLGSGAPGGAGTFSQGGPIGPAPDPSHEAVWSDQQVQQQVNNQRSQSAEQAATQQRGNARSTAALNGQVDASRMAGDAQAALDTRLNAAKMNADQGIARDKVNAANYAAQLDAQSRQRQSSLNYTSSLIAALAGMV